MERQVEKYRDVLQIISKKVTPTNSVSGSDQAAKDKRLKKIHEYMLGQALEDSAKELPDGNSFLFKKILDYCGKRGRQLRVMSESSSPTTINDLFHSANRFSLEKIFNDGTFLFCLLYSSLNTRGNSEIPHRQRESRRQ